jgi:hypothetical protein
MAENLVSKLGKTKWDICKLDAWEGGNFQIYLNVVHGIGIYTPIPSLDISYIYDFPPFNEDCLHVTIPSIICLK